MSSLFAGLTVLRHISMLAVFYYSVFYLHENAYRAIGPCIPMPKKNLNIWYEKVLTHFNVLKILYIAYVYLG